MNNSRNPDRLDETLRRTETSTTDSPNYVQPKKEIKSTDMDTSLTRCKSFQNISNLETYPQILSENVSMIQSKLNMLDNSPIIVYTTFIEPSAEPETSKNNTKEVVNKIEELQVQKGIPKIICRPQRSGCREITNS